MLESESNFARFNNACMFFMFLREVFVSSTVSSFLENCFSNISGFLRSKSRTLYKEIKPQSELASVPSSKKNLKVTPISSDFPMYLRLWQKQISTISGKQLCSYFGIPKK